MSSIHTRTSIPAIVMKMSNNCIWETIVEWQLPIIKERKWRTKSKTMREKKRKWKGRRGTNEQIETPQNYSVDIAVSFHSNNSHSSEYLSCPFSSRVNTMQPSKTEGMQISLVYLVIAISRLKIQKNQDNKRQVTHKESLHHQCLISHHIQLLAAKSSWHS